MKIDRIKNILYILAVAFSAFFFLNNIHADATAFKQYVMMNDTRWLKSDRRDLMERKWEICDRYKNDEGKWLPNVDPEIKDMYRELIQEIKEVEEEIEQKK